MGHISPSSSVASSVKPMIAYRESNLLSAWKKQTMSFPYASAGIPYQVLGSSSGATHVAIAPTHAVILRSLRALPI